MSLPIPLSKISNTITLSRRLINSKPTTSKSSSRPTIRVLIRTTVNLAEQEIAMYAGGRAAQL
eukprot:1478027-Rhodomonas_salina.1